MTYTLELNEETARRLEEQAAAEGLTPAQFIEKTVQSVSVNSTPEEKSARYATDEEVRALTKEIFERRAKVFEALAEGAK